ncbi:hypothetical protein J2857_006178 [Neorhizobium galegae]|uniref:hypothetical protein n=1 Tax=Neorhizobium galegae TaxID=399 RepID=UPI001AE75E31|nr:hypothetical protein [Neorhizobium galegae]MBP2563379.1 hypothetical protein [Neorhizobium galegae]
MNKSAKLIWLKDTSGGIIRAKIEAPSLAAEEFADLTECARDAGFMPLKSNWEAPEIGTREATSKFISAAYKLGVTVVEEEEP